MRSKHYLVLVAAGLSVAGLAACGDDTNQSTTGAGATGATSSSSTGSPTSTSSAGGGTPTSTSSGMGGGDGNDSFDTAEAAEVGTQIVGAISPDDDADFFKFHGTKGMKLSIIADAVPDGTNPAYHDEPDIVITLFDASQTQLAENDDPIPRTSTDSQLNTVLPADGDYYIRVTDFCFWTKNYQVPPGDCGAGVGPIITPDYTLDLLEITSMNFPSLSEEGAEPNDDGATATPLVYAPNQNADYYVPVIVGKFDTDTDVDVYSLTLPADVTPVDAGTRMELRFDVYPNGDVGNGSTAKTGNVWITTAAAPTAKIAQIDATQLEVAFGMTLSPPLDIGTPYLLYVEHASGEPAGTNPFYFVLHSWGGGNPVETADVTNDVAATAEALMPQTLAGGGTGYFISGDIGVAGVDVDYYTFDNDMSGPKMFVNCSAQRAGSGLRGLKVTLLKPDGTTVIDSGTEAADANIQIGGDMGLDTPSDASFKIKVEASSQDPAISSTYYLCGMGFTTPQ